MKAADFCKKINIICGHYGSGKTNLAVNLALDLKRCGQDVTLVDLDIVNPYFRSADFTAELNALGIRTISPTFANSNLDIPAITGEVYSVFQQKGGAVVIDVGGDDAGAAALGRYAHMLAQDDYTMLCVISGRRYLTRSPKEAAAILNEIAAACRIMPTGLINNTNLGAQTTARDVLDSIPFAQETAEQTGLALIATAFDKRLEAELLAQGGLENPYPVQLYVKPPWEERTNLT